jgi:peroxiredoxin
MRKLFAATIAATAFIATPLAAALPVGAKAPDFTAAGASAGKPVKIHLKAELAKGPLVLYFFPKAFTTGCDLEARAFSQAIGDFRKAGARVIGMSADDVPTLKKFSVKKCGNAFPVASASPAIQKMFDVAQKDSPVTTRTSYVIARDGRIVAVHDASDWSQHVATTLAAVRALK